MKKWYVACLTLVLLFAAAPVFAQEADMDDEDAIFMVADLGAQGQSGARTGAHQEMTGGHGGMMMGSHHGMMGVHGRREGAAFLDLSKEQIARIGDLHTRYYGETRNLRYDLMQRRLEVQRLFLDPKADSAAILAKQRELSAVRQKLMDAMARMMVDWRAILTPEQILKLDRTALANGRMGGMMGHGAVMGAGMGHEMGGGAGMGGGMMGGCPHCAMMGRGTGGHGGMSHGTTGTQSDGHGAHADHGSTGETK